MSTPGLVLSTPGLVRNSRHLVRNTSRRARPGRRSGIITLKNALIQLSDVKLKVIRLRSLCSLGYEVIILPFEWMVFKRYSSNFITL